MRALVSWERDFSEGKLIESELVFLAQDNDGNVWHLGQYRERYDGDGEFVGGRAWVSGLRGACAGIFMKANPQVGERAYSEGFAPPPIFWVDFGKVVKVGQKKCVPIGCFEDVVVIEEFDAFEPPGIFQLKFHAPGVGNIGVDFKGNDPEKEVLELVKLVHLSPEDMAKVHKRVKEHERRAYTYGDTLPVEPLD